MENIDWKLSVEQKLYIQYHLEPPITPPVTWYVGLEQYKRVQQWWFESWMEGNKPSDTRKTNEGIWHQIRNKPATSLEDVEKWLRKIQRK